MSDVTQLLSALGQGDPHAAEELLPLVYQEQRKLAAQRMAREQPGQTLQPMALVHEAYRGTARHRRRRPPYRLGRIHCLTAQSPPSSIVRDFLIRTSKRLGQ
jgi:hypothetical protein